MAEDVFNVEMVSDIALVRINNPPVNATSTALRKGLKDAICEVERCNAKTAILICSGRTFIAGGDMSEFDAPPLEPHLPDVVSALEDSSVPFVAAMHGNVLGGGLEIALGCAYRIALASARFGMPEVNVGLIPGAGGTQRLPRLVGLELAIKMCTDGKPISAHTFASAGGLDEIVEDDLQTAAIKFANSLSAVPTKTRERDVAEIPEKKLEELRQSISKSAKGRNGPLHNLEAVLWSLGEFVPARQKERALHLKLRKTPESKALRHAFFAERAVSKPEIISGVSPNSISSVIVVGGGLMGTGIATAILNADLPVTIIEQNEASCASAKERVIHSLDAAVKRGLIDDAQKARRLNKFSTSTSFEDAKGHDLAIEAVFEDTSVKAKVFHSLAQYMSDDAILATNTSYLNPDGFFKSIKLSSRCVGLHFFSPAHIMKLVEVIRLPTTSAQTLSTVFSFSKAIRKTAVLSGVCDGFIGNRMLSAYRREAEFMLAEGALPHEVDDAMRAFGFAMGPFETQDMSGLQIAWANRKQKSAIRDPKMRYVSISDQLCEAGRFGQRSSNGWYDYPNGPKSKTPSKDVNELVEAYSSTQNIKRNSFKIEEIADRLLAAMANEGALIVEEGIAENDAAVDVVKMLGYGFPRWRGGPMHYATHYRAVEFSKILTELHNAEPDTYKIAKMFGG